MKKYFGIMTAGLLVASSMFVPSVSNAVFTSVQVDVKSAAVTLTGGSLSFTATVKNVSNNAVATSVGWSGVTTGVTAWKIADQYIEMTSNVSLSNGSIRIYTDNTNNSANPKYSGPATGGAGLVNTTVTSQTLPLAWSIVDLLGAPASGPGDPNNTAQFSNWGFFVDKGMTSFTQPTTEDYIKVVGSGNMIHTNHQATPYPNGYFAVPSPNFVYLESDFTAGSGGSSYATNQITIEAYTI